MNESVAWLQMLQTAKMREKARDALLAMQGGHLGSAAAFGSREAAGAFQSLGGQLQKIIQDKPL